ncbi:hypothetical protein [Streptomyces sp. NPDC001889]
MPRPTAAQLAYGSATVVLSALALLLFTRTTAALGVAAIGLVSMALGLLVAVVLPMARAARTARGEAPTAPARAPVARVHAPPAHAGAGERAARR